MEIFRNRGNLAHPEVTTPRKQAATRTAESRRQLRSGKPFQRLFLVFLDRKQLVEPGDLEDLEDVGPDRAETEFPADRLHLFVEGNQLAQRRAREILDVGKVEHDLLAAILVDETEQLIADQLDISVRTVEVHRARVFEKMNVKSAVELANLLRPAA